MTTSVIDRTYEALNALRDRLPLLREEIMPGTPRRWNQFEISPETQARMNELARAERLERASNAARGIKPMGASPAPLNLNVLNTEMETHAGIRDVEREVCAWLGMTPMPSLTPAEVVTRIIGLLGRVESLPDLAEWVMHQVQEMNFRAARALGDVEPLHRISGRCPFCRARSLRALPERGVVACTNPACRCADEGCHCHSGRCHTWTLPGWEGLANMLEETEDAA